MNNLTESLITCYHNLIILEFDKINKAAFRFEDSTSRLTRGEVDKVLSYHSVTLNQLLSEGLLIQYPDFTFRTMHMDLIYRAIYIKAASWSPKIPLEFILPRPREEFVPSFEEISLNNLEKILPVPSHLCKLLIKALRKAGYKGLAFHQYYYLQKIIGKKYRCHLLVSPTASGKSLIFYLAILSSILSRFDVTGTKAIILYPRKALASDQLMKFLLIIYTLNDYLAKQGLRKIKVGIDDGDTPRSASSFIVKKKEVFRGVKCVTCNDILRYQTTTSNATVVQCENEKCQKIYDEIVATKGEIWSSPPDIIFSNLSALNRRLMMPQTQDLFDSNLEWIVMDEAHVYREELGGHARWLLRRILARFKVLMQGDIYFIVSSATIYDPTGFMTKLLGLDVHDIYYETYEAILNKSKKKRRKLTLDLIIVPNPVRSAESLAEHIALMLGTWGYSNSRKTLLFVDNISEVERLYDFVVKTIILDQETHNDHIDPRKEPIVADINNSFSWKSFMKGIFNIDPKKLAEIFNFHHAELSPEERSGIEEAFKTRNSGLLFSTSTLELGMDIRDIAAVIQYKVPITSESYFQRVGRAGRGDNVLRVALGILILTNSPSQIRYIFGDEYLRLIKPQVEIPVAWENEEIKKQHVIFSILDVLALKRYKTYLDYITEVKGQWLNVLDVLNSLQDIINQAKNHMSELKKYIIQMSADPVMVNLLNLILSEIEKKTILGQQQAAQMGAIDVEEGLKKLRRAEDEACAALRYIEKVEKELTKVEAKIPVQELSEYVQKLSESKNSLKSVLAELEKLWR